MVRRAVKEDHHAAAVVLSRRPAYVPPTPGSFPHRTPGGPMAIHAGTVTPEHVRLVVRDAEQALQAAQTAAKDAAHAAVAARLFTRKSQRQR